MLLAAQLTVAPMNPEFPVRADGYEPAAWLSFAFLSAL